MSNATSGEVRLQRGPGFPHIAALRAVTLARLEPGQALLCDRSIRQRHDFDEAVAWGHHLSDVALKRVDLECLPARVRGTGG